MIKPKILVTGATGKTGAAAVAQPAKRTGRFAPRFTSVTCGAELSRR